MFIFLLDYIFQTSNLFCLNIESTTFAEQIRSPNLSIIYFH